MSASKNYILETVVIVFIISLIVYLSLPELANNAHIISVKSSVDNKYWKVQGDLPCPKCAANKLAKGHKDLLKLIKYVNKEYPNDPRAKRLKKYNIKNVIEGRPNPGGSGDTSYVINKGEKIVHCIRSAKDRSKFVNDNLQIYTMVHEAAHIASSSIGHGEEFQKNFLWLLTNAVNIGIYKPIDYRKYPTEFCGLTVDASILY